MGQYFVTGTDTDVGKTIISTILVHKLGAKYWKPVQSGLSDGKDLETVRDVTNIEDSRIIPSVYEFQAPLSPHEAARLENKKIDFDLIKKPEIQDPLIVEGAGGVFVPLNDKYLMIDLIEKLMFPVIIVSRSGLGTINHTLLTLMALRERNIPIKGVIMNGEFNPKNREAIEQYGKIPVIAEIPMINYANKNELDKIDFEVVL